jgi:hypothetical protein
MKNLLNNKLALTIVALATALVTNAYSAQAAHAEPAADASFAQQGQMIDDSGLVITSYADGSLCEFKLSEKQLAAFKLFNQNSLISSQTGGQVLETIVASNEAR